MCTVAVARCHRRVHCGLIRGLDGKDALKVRVQMRENSPSKSTAIVIVRLAQR